MSRAVKEGKSGLAESGGGHISGQGDRKGEICSRD